ncbi:MAG: hypothetical protein KKD63_11145 [Proteobacteria bacterium]|nr:hypothetical protein [Pseudomonadota bacterium]
MAVHAEQGQRDYPGKSHLPSSESAALLVAALAAVGATSISAQIVLLKEFLSVFYGNELIIGIVLANWMILTGLGSFLGKFSERHVSRPVTITLVLIGLALLPMITVSLLRILRNIVFLPGIILGINQSLFYSLALLTPFCLLSGFSFAFFCSQPVTAERGKPHRLVLLLGISRERSWRHSIHTVASPRLDTFQALALLLLLDLSLAILVTHGNHHRLAAVCGALLIAAALIVGIADPDSRTRRFLFPGQELVTFKDTPYGNLTVTRQGDQMNFFENTVLMASTNDITAAEEGVHYTMVQHPKPHRVLLVGGGISGTPQEIIKYDVTSIDYTEINPWITDLTRTFTQSLTDQRIRIISDDARRHVRRTTTRYDVALINLPDPETAHLNRYFTVEFFRELKQVLSDGGIISISLLPTTEYQGPEARLLTSSLHATLKQIFANVVIVPGWRNYFLASDTPLDIHIGRLIKQKGIDTLYVNQYYLNDRMLEERSRATTAALDPAATLNTDFAPVCYFQQLDYWLSSLGASSGPWILLTLAALLMTLWKFNPLGLGIFTAGLCASSLEMILLIAFQTLYGSLYQMTGIVITSFMTGLAAGSWSIKRFGKQAGIDSFITLQLMVATAGMILAVALPRLQLADFAPFTVHLTFTSMTFTIAALIGMEFAVASQIKTGPVAAVAGELYGLDLAGSAIGALIVTVYAIPLLGIKNVSVLVGGISALSAGICVINRGRYQIRVGV